MSDDRHSGTDDLDRRIAEAKAAHVRTPAAHPSEGAIEGRGWAVGIEFIGAVVVGGLIGLLLDKWLHTAPWLMIVFLVLGFAAGLRRAIVTSKSFDANLNDDDR